MAVNTQVTTLSDIRTYLLDMLREPSVSTSGGTNDDLDRLINIALHDIHLDPNHYTPWAIRRGYITTHAPYTTGTVSITVSSSRTAVTGSSTEWNTAVTGFGFNNARIGGKIVFSSSNEVYEVSAVSSDTALTINPNWTGASLSGATYTYYEDEYALATDFLRLADMRNFSTALNIPILPPMLFRRMFPRNSTRAKPKNATVIQLSFSSATTPRYRVVLRPAPDDEYAIPYDYVTSYLAVTSAGAEQTQLTSDTDEPIIPIGMRHIIPLYVMVHWYTHILDDLSRAAMVKAEYGELMRRIRGTTNIGEDRARIAVDYTRYFGPQRLGRFDINNRFDELRDRWGR